MKKVIVIDDDPAVVDVLQQILTRAAYRVATAADGQEGIKHFESDPADLVITDLTMPGKDGMETIKYLKQHHPEVKIIAISGGGTRFPEYFLPMAKEAGAAAYLKKPFNKQELLSLVEEVLGTGGYR